MNVAVTKEFAPVRNAKTIAQQVHRTRALRVIGTNPSCRWLHTQPELLDELGRIDSDAALLVIAKRICELKPAAAEGGAMIRGHREFDQLADEIGQIIKDYVERNPYTTRTEILSALETAAANWGRVADVEQAGSHQYLHRA